MAALGTAWNSDDGGEPRAIAAMSGSNPAQPTIAAIVQSAPASAASISPARPPATRVDVSPSASRNAGSAASSATTASSALVARAAAASPATSSFAVSATIANRSGSRVTRSSVDRPIDPVAPSTVTRFAFTPPGDSMRFALIRRAARAAR